MEQVIYVTIKNVYGNELVYPACEKAKLFAKLAGHTTLTQHDVKTIKELGYKLAFPQKSIIN